ncbi:MAG TPA: lyase family protein, partial [Acidobacteriota bacterium]|nr:lyase family protein [Acidobacteriota bacterium]
MTEQVLRGAFDKPIDELILQFVASIECDKALIEVDITGSLAHVWMLEKTGVLSTEQAVKIRNGLLQILDEGIELKLEHEDVHMNIEKRLQELIGDDAKLLHTARSRNDQVALDLRLFVAQAQTDLISGLKALCQALVAQARKHHDVIMPGYTHLQRAQPVLLAHVLLSFAEGLTRDITRLQPNLISPLGAGALAGTAIPINPGISAQLLGAKGHFANSIDAVSDRDFAVEFVFACSLTAVHLSQLAENLILW